MPSPLTNIAAPAYQVPYGVSGAQISPLTGFQVGEVTNGCEFPTFSSLAETWPDGVKKVAEHDGATRRPIGREIAELSARTFSDQKGKSAHPLAKSVPACSQYRGLYAWRVSAVVDDIWLSYRCLKNCGRKVEVARLSTKLIRACSPRDAHCHGAGLVRRCGDLRELRRVENWWQKCQIGSSSCKFGTTRKLRSRAIHWCNFMRR